MSEENIQKTTQQQPEEQEIDLIELAQKVWAERKLVFKACGIAALIGLVVAFSIPKEYSTKVTLAPESAGKTSAGGMGALAPWPGLIWVELRPERMRCRPSYILILLSQHLSCWSCLM